MPQKTAVQNTATGWGRRKHIAENNIQWEKGRIKARTIISSQRGKHAKLQSMLNNESTLIAVCKYLEGAGEIKYFCYIYLTFKYYN